MLCLSPLHIGPGLGFGLPLRRYFHAPTFILASVLVDLEPFLVFYFGLLYPLHGYLHTFLLAIPVGVAFGYIMFLLERFLSPLYRIFLLETADSLSLKSFVAAGGLGTGLHVLLDTPLYSDIMPFYPITANPFYNPAITLEVYGICFLMGCFGIIYYIGLLGFTIYRKMQKESDVKIPSV